MSGRAIIGRGLFRQVYNVQTGTRAIINKPSEYVVETVSAVVNPGTLQTFVTVMSG